MNGQRTIPIITLEPDGAPPAVEEDAFSPHGKRLQALVRLGRKKEVDYGQMQKDLEKVQGQLGEIFESLEEQPAGGRFALNEVSVALAVSGGGNIGVAAVGVEASITLTFVRSKQEREKEAGGALDG
jgi:hypothetical protein